MIPKQSGTITLHDLQDLRRRVLLDSRHVESGDLDGEDVIIGTVHLIENLIDKLNGKPWIDATGYRYPGLDGSYPEEVQR